MDYITFIQKLNIYIRLICCYHHMHTDLVFHFESLLIRTQGIDPSSEQRIYVDSVSNRKLLLKQTYTQHNELFEGYE